MCYCFLFLPIGIIPSFEYYKFTNMRPPFTYASMIRWVSTAELTSCMLPFHFLSVTLTMLRYVRQSWSLQKSSLLWKKFISGLPACFSTSVTTLLHGRYELQCLYCTLLFVIPWLIGHKQANPETHSLCCVYTPENFQKLRLHVNDRITWWPDCDITVLWMTKT